MIGLNSSTITIPDEKHQSARQVFDLERETLELRRELQDTRNKKDEADQKVLRLVFFRKRSKFVKLTFRSDLYDR